jgi:hypothetical protein
MLRDYFRLVPAPAAIARATREAIKAMILKAVFFMGISFQMVRKR